MSWYPIAYTPPQYENTAGVPYSGSVLKAYRAGTNTNIPMATDYTGATQANSMVLNAAGYPTQGGAIVIPHVQENFNLALYPSQAAADADSGAVWTIPNIQIAPASTSLNNVNIDGGTMDGVTIGGDVPAPATVTQLNGGQLAGRRNLLLNSGFDVWQRGTSFASGASVVYTADRWAFKRSGGGTGATATRQTALSTASLYGLRAQRDNTNTSTAAVQIGFSGQSVDAYRYRGKTLMFSGKLHAGANFSASGGIVNVFITTGTGTDQNILGGFTGSVNIGSGNPVLSPGGAQVSFQCSGVVPTNATQIGVLIQYTPVGTAGTNDWIQLEELQLEVGRASTPFEAHPLVEELGLLEYYYEKTFEYATAPVQNCGVAGPVFTQCNGGSVAGTVAGMTFKKRKRATPTIVTFNPLAANAQPRNLNTAVDCSAILVLSPYDGGFYLSYTTAAGSGAGQGNSLHYTADAEMY